jgi:hypothetical protein
MDNEEELTDKYGNPLSGDRLIYCAFPDCGCDGARLCCAENGASDVCLDGNVEGMWSGKTKEGRNAVFKLLSDVKRTQK